MIRVVGATSGGAGAALSAALGRTFGSPAVGSQHGWDRFAPSASQYLYGDKDYHPRPRDHPLSTPASVRFSPLTGRYEAG